MKNTLSYKLIIAVCVPLLVLLVGCTSGKNNTTDPQADSSQNTSPSAAYQTISAAEAKRMMDEGSSYILLDVRTEEEFAEEHIEGALLIPNTEIIERAQAELSNKDETILLYCRSGRRSALAAQELASMGYTNVYDFGGIIDWPYKTVSQA